MKSNSRVLRGWRDFGVKATAIILTILLATQMVGTPAFASGALTNKQASEDIATTVDDTGVEPSGTEATDTTVPDEAAGAANEPAPADSTQATEEPVVETVESATEPATETPAADPAANAVLGTEPAPAPAVEQDQLASIKLDLADGASITLSKDGNKIDDDTNPIEVPANEELKFTVQAAEGMQVSAVMTVIDNIDRDPIAADENGEYTIAAEDVTDGLTVKVETSAVEGEIPSEGEEASTEDAAETGDEESTDPAAVEGENATEEGVTPESIADTATNAVETMVSEISLFAAGDESGTVPVTVKKTNDPNYSQTVNLPLGAITSESATAAVANLADIEGYEYRDARVDNVVVISLNQHSGTYYVTTGADQIAGIALENTTDVILYFQPEGSTYQVNYEVMLGNDEVTGDNIPGDLIGPETVNKGEDLSMSFVPDYGFEIEGVTVSDGLQADSSSGVYLIGSVNDTDGDRAITVTVSVKEIDRYDVVFENSSNTIFVFNGDQFDSKKGGATQKSYSPSGQISFTVEGFDEWNSRDVEKDFNKLIIGFDGDAYAINIPMGRTATATTTLDDLGYTITVTRNSDYGAFYPEFTITIVAVNGKVRGDISVVTNFKDRSNSEVWANVLVGVESLFTDNNSSSDAGDGYLTTGAGTQKYAVRNTDHASHITIKIAEGYDSNATPQLTIVVDGEEVKNPESEFALHQSGGDWVFTLPNDWGFERLGYEEPKDIRISVTIPSLERTYGAKFEGEDYDTQIKTETWSANDTFAVSDNTGAVPERDGFVFQGWTLKGDPNGSVYKNGVPFSINDDVINYVERGEKGVYYFTFVAQWVEADEADQVHQSVLRQ